MLCLGLGSGGGRWEVRYRTRGVVTEQKEEREGTAGGAGPEPGRGSDGLPQYRGCPGER